VKQFFALFGNGDAMKGFANIASSLVQALPALLALKGIMFLAAAGKSVRSLVLALTAIRGIGGGGGLPVVGGASSSGKGKVGPIPFGGPLLAATLVLSTSGDARLLSDKELLAQKQGRLNMLHAQQQQKLITDQPLLTQLKGSSVVNQQQVTINVNGGDPKQVTNALQQYLSVNAGGVGASGKFGR
jgi:hypothetical protein